MFAFKCFYFPSGFYIVNFIQMHCFHSSLDTIISIHSLGAARGTLRLHSRERLFLLLFTCLFNSGETFFYMTYLTSICGQRYSVLKFGQFVWLCSLLRYKNKEKKAKSFSSPTSQEPVAYTLL